MKCPKRVTDSVLKEHCAMLHHYTALHLLGDIGSQLNAKSDHKIGDLAVPLSHLPLLK